MMLLFPQEQMWITPSFQCYVIWLLSIVPQTGFTDWRMWLVSSFWLFHSDHYFGLMYRQTTRPFVEWNVVKRVSSCTLWLHTNMSHDTLAWSAPLFLCYVNTQGKDKLKIYCLLQLCVSPEGSKQNYCWQEQKMFLRIRLVSGRPFWGTSTGMLSGQLILAARRN